MPFVPASDSPIKSANDEKIKSANDEKIKSANDGKIKSANDENSPRHSPAVTGESKKNLEFQKICVPLHSQPLGSYNG